MFRWKQIVGAVVVPLVVYAYSPLKEHALNHYAIRGYLEKDPKTRSARVRVRNLYSAANMPITVHLGGTGSKIQDFDYADPWDGGEIRYLNSTRHSETLRQYARSLKHPLLLDEHLASSTLGDVEDELEVAALDESVPKRHGKKYGTADLLKEMTVPNHLLWLEECRVKNPAAHPCCMERAWEKWEYMLRGIQSDEIAFWRQAAGLQLQFSDFHFTPQGRTNFVLSLPVGHSAGLHVQYGFEPVNDPVKVTSTEGDVLMMKKEADLDRPALLMLYPYWQPEYGYEIAIVIGALLTVSLWAPLKYLSTHTLVNRALSKANKLETAEEWEEVYGRIKFSLKDKFDSHRSALGKPASTLSSEAIFDYLRGYLSLSYGGGLGRFQNEQQMKIAINGGLRTLASI
jgi:hypothetical protein